MAHSPSFCTASADRRRNEFSAAALQFCHAPLFLSPSYPSRENAQTRALKDEVRCRRDGLYVPVQGRRDRVAEGAKSW